MIDWESVAAFTVIALLVATAVFIIGLGIYVYTGRERKLDPKDGYDRTKILRDQWNEYEKQKAILQNARQEQLDAWDAEYYAIDRVKQEQKVIAFADELERRADQVLRERNPEVWARLQQQELEKMMRYYNISRAEAINRMMQNQRFLNG